MLSLSGLSNNRAELSNSFLEVIGCTSDRGSEQDETRASESTLSKVLLEHWGDWLEDEIWALEAPQPVEQRAGLEMSSKEESANALSSLSPINSSSLQ